MTPADEIERRIGKLQLGMRSEGFDGLFILQRVDLLYFSGTAQKGFLFIPARGAPLLLVKKYLPRAVAESPLKDIIQIQSVKDVPGYLVQYYGEAIHRVAFEWDVMPVREFHFLRQLFPGSECLDGSPLIHALRAIKSDWEIIQIERAARKSARVFDYIQENLQPGRTPLQIAGMVESFARAEGHSARFRIRDYQRKGFTMQALLQARAGISDPPCLPEASQGMALLVKSGERIERGEPVVMETRFVLNGYHMDESRTFAVGPLTGEAEAVSRRVLDLHNDLLERLGPGIETREWIRKTKKETRCLHASLSVTGHGIGLELIEPPLISPEGAQALEKGMVLAVAVETGMDSPLRAGIKSVVLVTEKGHRTLSRVPSCVLTTL
jgi:Xaa-Pro dipeptidase